MSDQHLGKYKLLEKLGVGATAEVYHARDIGLNRDVALKILKPTLVADSDSFQRFILEARTAANLFHPHIVTVLDIGEEGGRYFIAMRYINGLSLDRILRKKGSLSICDASKLAIEIGDALDFAHTQGFLHRDVKPSNILRDQKGGFWLSDFGLTKAMMTTGMSSLSGTVLGTPPYIAPEIWSGEKAEPGTDQYALACVVAEALSGKLLFTGETPPSIMSAHIMKNPDVSTLPTELHTPLKRALSKIPKDRFPDCITFARALQKSHPLAVCPKPAVRTGPKSEPLPPAAPALVDPKPRMVSSSSGSQQNQIGNQRREPNALVKLSQSRSLPSRNWRPILLSCGCVTACLFLSFIMLIIMSLRSTDIYW
jgi:eukaryotic-like serine/threonine-protein kinase